LFFVFFNLDKSDVFIRLNFSRLFVPLGQEGSGYSYR